VLAPCFCVVCTVLKLEIPLMVELMVLEASHGCLSYFPQVPLTYISQLKEVIASSSSHYQHSCEQSD
jgi:hypothetical protein